MLAIEGLISPVHVQGAHSFGGVVMMVVTEIASGGSVPRHSAPNIERVAPFVVPADFAACHCSPNAS
jgi:hypothetical protein